MRQVTGFTLIEMLLVVVIISIASAVAIPNIGSFMDKQKVVDVAEIVFEQVIYARSEAIARSQDVYVNVYVGPLDADNNPTWAIGVSTDKDCDPTIGGSATANACVLTVDGQKVLKRIVSTDHLGVAVTSPNVKNQIRFDPVRGTVPVGNNGTFLVSYKNRELQIIVGVIGRVKICTDPDNNPVGGYSSCV